jgi:hypothetical protein
VRSIARAEGRDRETVAKIIRTHSGEVLDYTTGTKEDFRNLAGVALESLGHALERKGSGWLAFRFLEAIGGFPDTPERRPTIIREPTAAELKEARIQAACARFAAGAYERSRVFDAPLVDVQKGLRADEPKLNGTTGNGERNGDADREQSSEARRSILDSMDEDLKGST